mmetsp:Transcript_52175/g.60935  ORF Transcript_52175/g.60935 Transcript_52175/m.60935 type:complete len:90 (-) Transcript_52175:51-320(-)
MSILLCDNQNKDSMALPIAPLNQPLIQSFAKAIIGLGNFSRLIACKEFYAKNNCGGSKQSLPIFSIHWIILYIPRIPYTNKHVRAIDVT